MTKSDLVEAVAKETKLPKTEVAAVINATLEAIQGTIAKKTTEDVVLTGFGTFTVAKRKERQGRNPKTGEAITIPAMRVPRFKAGKALKTAVK